MLSEILVYDVPESYSVVIIHSPLLFRMYFKVSDTKYIHIPPCHDAFSPYFHTKITNKTNSMAVSPQAMMQV
jgi:hypothetical protein